MIYLKSKKEVDALRLGAMVIIEKGREHVWIFKLNNDVAWPEHKYELMTCYYKGDTSHHSFYHSVSWGKHPGKEEKGQYEGDSLIDSKNGLVIAQSMDGYYCYPG